jgi:hypothetical protein
MFEIVQRNRFEESAQGIRPSVIIVCQSMEIFQIEMQAAPDGGRTERNVVSGRVGILRDRV